MSQNAINLRRTSMVLKPDQSRVLLRPFNPGDSQRAGRIIARLRTPLLQPNEKERKGYVPNVVYTCGALRHKSELIIPYGLADHATGFATVPVGDVLAAMDCAKGRTQ